MSTMKPHRALAGVRVARAVTAVALALGVAGAGAADLAREQRWADEILPGLVVGDAVYLDAAGRRVLALHTDVPGARSAAVLVHGKGMHPDWGITGALRVALAERGLATLAVQMPVRAADAPSADYQADLPEAAARLDAALAFLAPRHAQVYVIAHSLGAHMADAWLARTPAAPVAGIVMLGAFGTFSAAALRHPLLDVVAESDFPEVRQAATGRAALIAGRAAAHQRVVPGTDHYLTGAERETAEEIVRFVSEISAKP